MYGVYVRSMEYRTLDEPFKNRTRISNPFISGYEYYSGTNIYSIQRIVE